MRLVVATPVTMDIDVDSEIAADFTSCQTPQGTTYSRLRAIKNALVGNPSAKAQIAISGPYTIRAYVSLRPFRPQDVDTMSNSIVHAINLPGDEDGVGLEKCQIEAAHVLASLTYGMSRGQICPNSHTDRQFTIGSPQVVIAVLEAGAAEALLNALASCGE
jgi:hypothetical protein